MISRFTVPEVTFPVSDGAGAVAGLIQPAFNAICCCCLNRICEQRHCTLLLERYNKRKLYTTSIYKAPFSILTETKWEEHSKEWRTYETSSFLKAILISESDGEANPYYFFNSIIIPGEWRGTQAFHFLEPTSWKSAMNLDTVAAARELNWENEAGSDLLSAHLKYYGLSRTVS